METTNNTESEIVARRTTFDGVQIFLHADGVLSTRMQLRRQKQAPDLHHVDSSGAHRVGQVRGLQKGQGPIHVAESRGRKLGREQERIENPAIKSVGEAVATARRADRAAIRAVLTKVFDEESARGNPYAAFSQALKAIAD